jgi:hypothetical protein
MGVGMSTGQQGRAGHAWELSIPGDPVLLLVEARPTSCNLQSILSPGRTSRVDKTCLPSRPPFGQCLSCLLFVLLSLFLFHSFSYLDAHTLADTTPSDEKKKLRGCQGNLIETRSETGLQQSKTFVSIGPKSLEPGAFQAEARSFTARHAMSLVDHIPPEREVAGHSSKGPEPELSYKSSPDTYDHTIMDDFFTTDDHAAVHAEVRPTQHNMDAPILPPKSSLRASRLLDTLSMKSGVSGKAPELSQATLHEVYMSSEEDASSSADDFSDYDWDSETDDTDAQLPRRNSHEAEARVVSVVFMGKPSIIDLPSHRRSTSSNSIEARRRASTVSSMPSLPRAATSTDTISSSTQRQSSPRKSSLVSSLLSRKKPLFLNIDPYANGSSYSLDTTSMDTTSSHHADDDLPLKTPRTPTFLKNMSKTMSLVRKKSRPVLNALDTNSSTPPPQENHASSSASPLRSVTEPIRPTTQPLPSPTVTYNDIIKASNRNSFMAPQHSQPSPISEEHSPLTPSSTHPSRRGILSGLASRRKSFKLTGRVI